MDPDENTFLSIRDVRFGYPGRGEFLGPVSVDVGHGQCWAIVGPNGAGKSTLLRLMAGLLTPLAGEVALLGQPMGAVSARNRGRRLAFLPQQTISDLDLSVRAVVLMGRFPHRSLGLFESRQDFEVADRAMQATATQTFADRRLQTLSGGEAQRVHIAAALAQEPRVMLLDEPTTSLDLEHQLAIFKILRERTDREGMAVVVVTHDVNLAAKFCTHVLVLAEGRQVATGSPSEVVTPEVLSPIYRVALRAIPMDHGDHGTQRWIVPDDGMGEGSP